MHMDNRIFTCVAFATLLLFAFSVSVRPAVGQRFFFKLNFMVGAGRNIWLLPAELWKEELATIGIEVEILTVETDLQYQTTFETYDTYEDGGWDMVLGIGTEVLADPGEVVLTYYGDQYWPEEGGMNVARWSHAVASDLLERANVETDLDERKRLYSEFTKIYLDEMPVSTLYVDYNHHVFAAGVQGLDDYVETQERLRPVSQLGPFMIAASRISGGTAQPDTFIALNRFLPPNQIGILGTSGAFGRSATLLMPNEEGMAGPGLAESWDVSPDGLNVTFHLRDDVSWSDGEPFTSEDVKFTYELIMNEDVGARLRKAFTDNIESMETPNDTTIIMNLKKVSAGFYSLLFDAYTTIEPEHILSAVAPEDLKTSDYNVGYQSIPGLGPYILEELSEGDYQYFVANPEYVPAVFGETEAPGMQNLYLRIAADTTAAVAALEADEADCMLEFYRPADIIGELLENNQLAVRVSPTDDTMPIIYNHKHPILANKWVRLAMDKMIPREDIWSELYSESMGVTATWLGPNHWAYDSSITDPIEYDRDMAIEYMKKAGYDMAYLEEAAEGMPWYYPFAGGLAIGIVVAAVVAFWRRR